MVEIFPDRFDNDWGKLLSINDLVSERNGKNGNDYRKNIQKM